MHYSSDIEKEDRGIGKTLRMEEGGRGINKIYIEIRQWGKRRDKLILWQLVEELRG